MTSQDYQNALIAATRLTENTVRKLLESLGDEMLHLLEEEGSSLGVEGFGRFVLCKHAEHVVNNPATRKQMLVPPCITLEFLSDATLSACATTYGTTELARALEAQQKISRATAEEFVSAAVAQLQEALRQEHYVNVPGLGTFKYIAPTGAIEFAPNTTLRERANRPFAAFESIELEATVEEPNDAEEASRKELEEMLQFGKDLPDAVPVVAAESEVEPTAAEPTVTPEPLVAPEASEPLPTITPQASADLASTEASNQPTEAEADLEPQLPEDTEEEDAEDMSDTAPSHWLRHLLAHILLPILLLAGGYMAGHYRLLDGVMPRVAAADSLPSVQKDIPAAEPTASVPTTDSQEPTNDAEAPSSMPTETSTPSADDIVPVGLPYADYVARSQQFEQLPAHRRYMIVGKMAECQLQEGETLRQIAKRYYKVPEMADYIQKFNQIDSPETLPVGTTLKIPRLILKKD